MSNNFLQLSPSSQTIDPEICSFTAGQEKENKTSKDNGNHGNKDNNNPNSNEHTVDYRAPAPPSSVTKSYGPNFTGWTPLITRTIYNEQGFPFSVTPNKVGGPISGDGADFNQGLNLTPFLNHNINLLNSQPGSQLHSITPFNDKMVRLTDFFMDSPIRQTPIKDVDTITPSKFRLESEKRYLRQSIFQDPKSTRKRTITQIDTPHGDYSVSENIKVQSSKDDAQDEDKENDEVDGTKTKYCLQTPSKKPLGEHNKSKTPVKYKATDFLTPAKQIPDSSPSTVILSAAKGKSPDGESKDSIGQPPSPTPKKEINVASCSSLVNGDSFKPAMGVFSERKPTRTNVFSSSGYSNENDRQHKPKASNKAQMQAGMNKFQIVFTDVHTLMNNKNKNKKTGGNKKKKLSYEDCSDPNNEKKKMNRTPPIDLSEHQDQIIAHHSMQQQVVFQQISQQSTLSSQDQNTTMNSSKEISMISGSSSNLNMSSQTEQSSFDLSNGNLFPDKLFDKPSPQPQRSTSHGNHLYLQGQLRQMPPPSRQQAYFQQHNHSMMMMSTPQHSNVVTYGPGLYQGHSDMSPNDNMNITYPYNKGHTGVNSSGEIDNNHM